MDLESVADELYALTPEEFTAARTAHEKEAKTAGDKDLAGQIHALAKPNQVAWLANQLARQHADEVRPLLDLGAGMRGAAGSLTGDQLRDFTKQKRQLVAALVQQARRLATSSGHKVSDVTARGLEDTLNAGLADPAAAARLVAGRLATGLQHSGFGPAPGGSAGGTSPVPGQRLVPGTASKRPGTRASERLAGADADLLGAGEAAAEAAEELAGARAEQERADADVSRARDDVTRLRDELDHATEEQSQAERRERQTRSALDRAERAAQHAARRLQEAQEKRDLLAQSD